MMMPRGSDDAAAGLSAAVCVAIVLVCGCAPPARTGLWQVPNTFQCDGVRFVLVPRGERMLGTNSPQAQLGESPECWFRLDYALYMSREKITLSSWDGLLGEVGRELAVRDPNPDFPALVTWDNAMEFCKRFEAKLGAQTGRKWECRLPTEAEWEYAARYGGPPGSEWWAGQDVDTGWYDLDKVAWYKDNAGDHVHPVAEKQASVLGMFDMLGNRKEWCYGWFSVDTDVSWMISMGAKVKDGDGHPLRGGSIYTSAERCRPTARGYTMSRGEPHSFRIVVIPKD